MLSVLYTKPRGNFVLSKQETRCQAVVTIGTESNELTLFHIDDGLRHPRYSDAFFRNLVLSRIT